MSASKTVVDYELEIDKLREVGESLRVAMWDAHYGSGITAQYAQAVDKEWRDALKGGE